MTITATITNGTVLAPTITTGSTINVSVTTGVLGSGGSSTLEGLTDTNITSPSNDEVLKYNSTSGKWENGVDDNEADATTVVLNDNQSSAATIFSYAKTKMAGFVNVLVTRGTDIYAGNIIITNDGTDIVDFVEYGSPVLNGVTFSAEVNGSNIDFKYTSTATGAAPSLTYKNTLL